MNDELIFQILFIVLFLLGTGIRGYYGRKTVVEGTKRSARERWQETVENEGKPLAALLIFEAFFMLIAVILYIFFLPWVPWSQFPLFDLIRWIGFIVGVISLPFLIWVHRVLGLQFTPSVEFQEAHKLVTAGPYRRVRHPMYTVHIVYFFSWVLVSSNFFILILFIISLVLMIARIPKEEQRLLEYFGDEYRVYMKRTGRLLPPLRWQPSDPDLHEDNKKN